MREFYAAAVGFPAFFFTSALVIVAGFWLLVLLGAAEVGGFDGDVPLGALGLGGLPVTVAVTSLTATGWFTGLAGSIALDRLVGPGLSHTLLSLLLFVAALLAGHQATGLLARWWRRLRQGSYRDTNGPGVEPAGSGRRGVGAPGGPDHRGRVGDHAGDGLAGDGPTGGHARDGHTGGHAGDGHVDVPGRRVRPSRGRPGAARGGAAIRR
ncbi:hypothetical protein ACFPM3_12820 [Streptomyces coeruleoprunus]|uniref:Uncharacterized protein n=1 Tax=Streptomyces coeruleoprunus TaxID=285563 RepID=A0ABV9XFD3_9ACTN